MHDSFVKLCESLMSLRKLVPALLVEFRLSPVIEKGNFSED